MGVTLLGLVVWHGAHIIRDVEQYRDIENLYAG